jgi:hypothetical protein
VPPADVEILFDSVETMPLRSMTSRAKSESNVRPTIAARSSAAGNGTRGAAITAVTAGVQKGRTASPARIIPSTS